MPAFTFRSMTVFSFRSMPALTLRSMPAPPVLTSSCRPLYPVACDPLVDYTGGEEAINCRRMITSEVVRVCAIGGCFSVCRILVLLASRWYWILSWNGSMGLKPCFGSVAFRGVVCSIRGYSCNAFACESGSVMLVKHLQFGLPYTD